MAAPSNRYVYATSCEEDVIDCGTFDAATGMLSSDAVTFGVEVGAGPRHLEFDPSNAADATSRTWLARPQLGGIYDRCLG